MKQLLEKLKESVQSILPIYGIIILLLLTGFVKLTSKEIILSVIGTVLLIIGMTLFTLGADIAMSPIGNSIGKALVKKRKIWLVVAVVFLLGLLITIAEPDLTVLATQVTSKGNDQILIKMAVGIGVGLFLVLAVLKIIFHLPLHLLLIIGYAVMFIITIFVGEDFLPLSFDSGGVTTGPITVPFIMALGVGIASNQSNKEDNFGLIALSSIGPIIAVMVLGIVWKSTPNSSDIVESSNSIITQIIHGLGECSVEILLVLVPIVVFFLIFNAFFIKMERKRLSRILIGILYSFVGLVLFLTAVNVGYLPIGHRIGEMFAGKNKYLLIPLSFILGLLVVLAEPAVHVLNKQVEEISSGSIKRRSILLSLSVAVGISLALSMVRIIYNFSILFYIIPGYLLCIVLSFFVPKIYTAIAFDSGGVASGPMTAGFILPLALGACNVMYGTTHNGFGVVAMVAMTPILTIELLGMKEVLSARIRSRYVKGRIEVENENQIINFD